MSLYGDYGWEPLSLGYVAAATPPGWDVELVDEQCEGLLDYRGVQADLVGITAFTTQAPRAYQIAGQFRSRGIPVVMGGIHASLVPDEAARFTDAIFIGECEAAWPQVIADFRAGALKPRYDGGTTGTTTVEPDRRLFEKYQYQYASAQTSRGCPMDCSFCSVTAFNGRLFRMRGVDEVVSEMASIAARDIIFVDDDLNGFSRRARERCLELFRAMAAANLGKQWITQVTINFGDDDELPRLARAAGCAGVFIGLESTDTASLMLIRKDGMSQRRGLSYYRENLARIRSHGIGVVGSFILGIDSQDMSTIVGDILRFAHEVELDGLNPTILTPLPGTRDYARLDAEGRILFKNYPEDWEKYTLAFPVTTHAQRQRRRADETVLAGAAVLPARARRRALLAHLRIGVARGGVARVLVEPGLDQLLPARQRLSPRAPCRYLPERTAPTGPAQTQPRSRYHRTVSSRPAGSVIAAVNPSASRARATEQTKPTELSSTSRAESSRGSRPSVHARSPRLASARTSTRGTGIGRYGRRTATAIWRRNDSVVCGSAWPMNMASPRPASSSDASRTARMTSSTWTNVNGRGARTGEQKESARGQPDQRQERAVARTIDGRRPEDDPRHARMFTDDDFTGELAAPVGVDRARRVGVARRPCRGSGSDRGLTGQLDEAGAAGVGRLDDRPRAEHVDDVEGVFMARTGQTRGVHDDIGAGDGFGQRVCGEW